LNLKYGPPLPQNLLKRVDKLVHIPLSQAAENHSILHFGLTRRQPIIITNIDNLLFL